MNEIEVKHLSKTFEQKGIRVDALKDINLTIESGDIYGIIGMSGAGKSTLVPELFGEAYRWSGINRRKGFGKPYRKRTSDAAQ